MRKCFMKTVTVNSFNGIFNELFDYNQTITGADCYLQNGFFDVNSCFWSTILDADNIQACINTLQTPDDDLPIEIQAILHDPLTFMERFSRAKIGVSKPIGSAKKLFIYLETLQMACCLYYHAKSKPFKLRIDAGFLRSSDSAKELNEDCLLPFCNPYLAIIEKSVLPLLEEQKPDIIWFSGRPNIGTFAIAKLIKKRFPNVIAGITNHTSEYYSLNKITPILLNNHDLFEVFDVVTLHYDTTTRKSIEEAFEQNKDWFSLPNIIYTPDHGQTITWNPSMPNTITLPISAKEIPDVTLFPENHCYWNQCSFCGINKKYIHNGKQSWDMELACKILESLDKRHISGFWCVDEAIPPKALSQLAKLMLEKGMCFQWHVRTRIDRQLLSPALCNDLKNAGLKNILMGLESAVPRILNYMNKTNEAEDYIEIAELLVKQFNEAGITVHFPVIIGFPTETEQERMETLNFIEYLHETYPLFTYNVNVLELDVSSYLYHHFEQFNISQLLYPCPPNSFIGNWIDWICQYVPNNPNMLYEAQKASMEKQLTWYPKDALLPIVSYFKLLEHVRLSFLNNTLLESGYLEQFSCNQQEFYSINKNCCFFKTLMGNYVIYNWETSQYVIGGALLEIIYSKRNGINCAELLEGYSSNLQKDIIMLLQTLYEYKILIKGGESNV